MPKGRGDIGGGAERHKAELERLLDGRDNKENISRSQRDRHLASERCSAGVEWEWRGSSAICDFSEQGRGREKRCEGTSSILFDHFYRRPRGNEDLVQQAKIRRNGKKTLKQTHRFVPVAKTARALIHEVHRPTVDRNARTSLRLLIRNGWKGQSRHSDN